MQTLFQKMAEKDVLITGEVLNLFWDCLDEDILCITKDVKELS